MSKLNLRKYAKNRERMKMMTSMRKIIHFGALESKLKYVFNVKVGFQIDFKDTLEIEIQ